MKQSAAQRQGQRRARLHERAPGRIDAADAPSARRPERGPVYDRGQRIALAAHRQLVFGQSGILTQSLVYTPCASVV